MIQTYNNDIVHDFSFHLLKSIDFNNWYSGKKEFNYIKSESVVGYPNCIPVGSLEFVFDYMEMYYNLDRKFIKPLNIPIELMVPNYLGRKCYISSKDDLISEKDSLFIKSNSKYKSFVDVVSDKSLLEDDEYLVSEVVDFESEWRAFIQNGNLVGIKNYLGDFTLMPDIVALTNMIKDYKESPLSYTLDVGILDGNTVIIEVHPFVSCGLYGFSDYGKIVSMTIQGFNYMKNEAEKFKISIS